MYVVERVGWLYDSSPRPCVHGAFERELECCTYCSVAPCPPLFFFFDYEPLSLSLVLGSHALLKMYS